MFLNFKMQDRVHGFLIALISILDDGIIYICGGEGKNLYAIKGTEPLASSHWPKMQKDNNNSGLIDKE